MTLRAWRESNDKSLEECAALFGVANGKVVWRWENGISIPHRRHMVAIYVATGGAVRPDHFYALPDLERAVAA